MIIRAWLVKLHEKRKKKTQFISQSANQPAPSSTNQTPTQGGNGRGVGVRFFFFFFLPSASLTIFFSLFSPVTTHYTVFGTAALIFLCGRRRILKATITAQNYQFPLQLTLWEERGQRSGGRGKRRG